MTGGGTPDSSSESNWTDSGEGIPWVSIADITRSFEIKNTIKDVTRKGMLSKNLKVLPVDTVLYSIYASLGKVAVTKVPLVTNQAILGLETRKQLDSSFLVFWLIHIQPLLSLYSTSNTQENLNAEKVGNLPLYIPSLIEQKRIASFLDYEAAKIDILIEKQQRLIELLTEKRQAVISHAVTKGLNPDVPMKDSGVEWLGEVPGHWEVGYLGYYATLETGATPSRANLKYWNGNIPWVKTGEIRYDTIYETEEKVTDLAIKQTSIRLSPAGTLLMAMYGQGITRGRVALLGVPATYNQACVAITVNDEVFNEYMKWYFIAGYKALRDGGNETSQMNLNADIVRKFKVLVPSIYEQKSIVDYLINKLPTFDNLLNKANQQIQLMQERRTALISAAVTGKIDVRDWDVHVASEVCS